MHISGYFQSNKQIIMKNLNLEAFDVQGMSTQEMKQTDGGFIPLVIFGIAFSAKAVAGMCFGALAVGVGASAAN